MPDRVGLDSTHVCAPVGTPTVNVTSMSAVRVSSQNDHISRHYGHLPALLTVKDVIRESGLSKTTVFSKIKSGEIKSILPTPKTRRVPLPWFVEWIEQCMAHAASQADA